MIAVSDVSIKVGKIGCVSVRDLAKQPVEGLRVFDLVGVSAVKIKAPQDRAVFVNIRGAELPSTMLAGDTQLYAEDGSWVPACRALGLKVAVWDSELAAVAYDTIDLVELCKADPGQLFSIVVPSTHMCVLGGWIVKA